MDAPGDASTGSIRFATIYPASLSGSMTRAMMLSEPCFLITTPVFDYPGQVQAVTGTVAVFSSAPANSEIHFCCQSRFWLNHRKSPVHIKINRVSQYAPDNLGQFICQRDSCFQKPTAGFKILQPSPQIIITLFYTPHYCPGTMDNERSQASVAIFRHRRQPLFSARSVLAGNQSTSRR